MDTVCKNRQWDRRVLPRWHNFFSVFRFYLLKCDKLNDQKLVSKTAKNLSNFSRGKPMGARAMVSALVLTDSSRSTFPLIDLDQNLLTFLSFFV